MTSDKPERLGMRQITKNFVVTMHEAARGMNICVESAKYLVEIHVYFLVFVRKNPRFIKHLVLHLPYV